MAPPTSMRPAAARPGTSGSSRSDSSTTTTPTGTFTRKIQCQLRRSVSTPPSSTPAAPPPDSTNPKMPIAFARAAGSWKSVITSASATEDTSAPPSPCAAREPVSIPCVVETPHSTDAAVNVTTPSRNSRR